jgi:hypothetical protein
MGFLDGSIINSDLDLRADGEPALLICNGYSTCSNFKSKSEKNSDPNKINFNDVNIVSKAINSYWCIFQQPF